MTPNSNIVLTGFMGTGKTTVGRLLAQQIGYEFVDTDAVIEDRHGPIPDIFRDHGEPRFRDIERKVAGELAHRSGLVIATGGRMMLDPANISALSSNGRVFCLLATPDEILDRVMGDSSQIDRPLLAVPNTRQRIIELLAERHHGYSRFAQLATGGQAPESIADDIARLAAADPHRVTVNGPFGYYDHLVGVGLLPFIRQLAAIEGPIVVVAEPRTEELYLPSLPDTELTVVLPATGGGKLRQQNIDLAEMVNDRLVTAGIDRSATVVSLGDSLVGDVAAFAASTYLRGLDFVHCPTDLIAMSANLGREQGRNLVKHIKQPKAVVADVVTLQSLGARRLAAGLAEVVKHGLIADSELIDQIENDDWVSSDYAPAGRLDALQALVVQAAQTDPDRPTQIR